MTAANWIFLGIVLVSVGFFLYNVRRLVGELRMGRHDDNRWNEFGTRLGNLIQIGIFQRKIFRDSIAGPMHAAIFWGFLVLGVSTTEYLLGGIFPGFTFASYLSPTLNGWYVSSSELVAALVLVAVGFALFRRLTKRVQRLLGKETHPGDPLLILTWIAALMVTMFLEDYAVAWWAHGLLVLGFLNYLPYSKHLHVVVSLPNTFLANTSGPGVVGAMRKMDFEGADAEVFGAKDVDELSWKSLLDGFACTECGRCTSVCPANLTGKMLSPRKIMINVRERLEDPRQGRTGKTLLGDFITDEELWACTSCRACVYECPVSIDQLSVINELRRNLVLSESRFPEEVMPAFESLEASGSPWAFDPGDRGKWAEGLNIPTMAELAARGESPEVLYWVGCMGSFDDRAKKTTVALREDPAGAKRALRDPRTGGEVQRRPRAAPRERVPLPDAGQGQRRDAGKYGVKTVVTACPHCFHQLGNEYPQFGGNYEVVHHSTYIEQLMEAGRVPDSRGPPRVPSRRSRTTTPVISGATTTCTTRRARRSSARCRS